MRGWTGLYRTSVGLGLRHLVRHGYMREAVVRVVIPLDPSRYVELPWTLRELRARPGDRVLDLASPKLLAVVLARSGVEVTAVDELRSEIEAWDRLVGDAPALRFEIADGRALPFAAECFDAAYSVSVLEHIPDDGDAQALRELARVTRPGGRVVVTLTHAPAYWEEWRDAPVYSDNGEVEGRYFFQRWYDPARVDRLVAAVPELELLSRQVVRLQPNWSRAYARSFPWLVPVGPFYGLLAREKEDRAGDVVRLALVRS